MVPPQPPVPNHASAAHNRVPAGTDGDLRHATDVLGDRWLLLLIGALAGGPRRFGDLSDDLVGVAPNVLADRLRRAQRAGLITGRAYQQRPRRLAYDLTAAGRDAARFLPAMAAWSARRRGTPAVSHSSCGTPLELRWWCPECNETATTGATSPPATTAGGASSTPAEPDRVVWV